MADENQDHRASDHQEIEGGPGVEVEPTNPAPSEQPATPEGPATEKVRIAGQELEVAPEIAAAIKAREEEFNRKISEQGNELGELRRLREAIEQQQQAQQQAQQQPEEEEDDIESLLFENPKAALERVRQQTKAELRQELNAEREQERQQRQVEEQRQQFTSDFFGKNEDLKDDEEVVWQTLQKNMRALKDLPVDEAMEKLADLTRQRLISIAKRFGTQPEGSRAVAEGANTPAPPAQERSSVEEPKSMSQVIKERRRARSQAKTQAA